jgi:hypothetical protein
MIARVEQARATGVEVADWAKRYGLVVPCVEPVTWDTLIDGERYDAETTEREIEVGGAASVVGHERLHLRVVCGRREVRGDPPARE